MKIIVNFYLKNIYIFFHNLQGWIIQDNILKDKEFEKDRETEIFLD